MSQANDLMCLILIKQALCLQFFTPCKHLLTQPRARVCVHVFCWRADVARIVGCSHHCWRGHWCLLRSAGRNSCKELGPGRKFVLLGLDINNLYGIKNKNKKYLLRIHRGTQKKIRT